MSLRPSAAIRSARAHLARPWVPYALSFALQLLIAPWLIHDWDGFVLIRSAQDFLGGITPYHVSEAAPPHIFLDDQWPPVNTWYAYPPLTLLLTAPFVGLAQLLTDGAPWALRLGLKLPMILGTLAVAYVAGRIVGELAGIEKRRLAERLLLLNPFLIFLSAAWGMFDAIMMALLLASVLLLARRSHVGAGVAFGLAALVKVFPLFVAPLYALHVWRRDGLARASRFVGAAVATATAVALPFFLAAPAGFARQVLTMHWERGAQGFALVSFPLQLQNLNNLFGWSIPIAPRGIVLAASGMLLLVVVLLLHARWHTARTSVDLLRLTSVVFIAVLLVNKVVNEQYFVMPIVLLTVLGLVGALPSLAAARAYTWGAFVSSLLIGLHFVTFIPADLTGGTTLRPDEAVQAAAWALDLPVLVVFSIPHAIAILVLVPALVHSVRIVAPELRDAARDVARWLAARLRPVSPRGAPRVAAFAVLALVAAPPITSGVLAAPEPMMPAPELPGAGILLARYDLAISNPSHDPEVRDGFWARGAYPETADGYYSATTEKVRADLATLRASGVDVVLVGYDGGNRLRLGTFLEAARESDLRAAPVIDLGALAHCPDSQRLRPSDVPALGPQRPATDAHVHLATTCARAALEPFVAHSHAFRVDGRTVLWVRNATHMDAPLRAALPEAWLVAALPPSAATAIPPWADAAYVQAPAVETLEAFLAAPRPPTAPRIAAAFPSTWTAPDAHEATWAAAGRDGAEWVVVPWNNHREGGAIEPLARGDAHLRTAAAAAARWRAP